MGKKKKRKKKGEWKIPIKTKRKKKTKGELSTQKKKKKNSGISSRGIIKVVDTISVGIYRTGTNINIEMSTFRSGLNTGQFQAIPASTRRNSWYRKKFFFFFWIFVRAEW